MGIAVRVKGISFFLAFILFLLIICKSTSTNVVVLRATSTGCTQKPGNKVVSLELGDYMLSVWPSRFTSDDELNGLSPMAASSKRLTVQRTSDNPYHT